jgi:hypothetical protein
MMPTKGNDQRLANQLDRREAMRVLPTGAAICCW